MGKRLRKFTSLGQHIWYARLYHRLNKNDVHWCQLFIEQNDHLDADGFSQVAVRVFLDQPTKPRNADIISELLLCCASMEDDNE